MIYFSSPFYTIAIKFRYFQWTKLYVGVGGSGRICNNCTCDGITHFLMNIHEMTPHNQATGLANWSLASVELKCSQRLLVTTGLNVSEKSDLDEIVTVYLYV